MAYTFTINQTAGVGSDIVYRLKTALVASGWTVTKSSDGTTYNSTGDQITHTGTGAGGIKNARAWFVIRQPGTNQREFCIQRSSDASTLNYNWRIKYSGGPSTGFVGGTPSATQVPSATDEATLLGGGTDASPTFSNWFTANETILIKSNILVGDASSNYNFLMFCHAPQGPSATLYNYSRYGALGIDAVTNYSVGDPDPVVVYFDNATSTGQFTSHMTDTTSSWGGLSWYKKGIAGAGFVKTPVLTYGYGTTTAIPYTIGQHPLSFKDITVPVVYGRNTSQAAPNGFKGVSTLFELCTNQRIYGTMMTRSTTNDRLILGYVSIPWNGTTLEL